VLLPRKAHKKPSVFQQLLRFPLTAKLVGAHVIVLGMFVGVALLRGWDPIDGVQPVPLAFAAAASLVATIALVILALRPIRNLENTARLVWNGDYDARVPYSRLADASMLRVATIVNASLDRLTSDSERARLLAASVIRSSDEERSRSAFHLHESSAQIIASIAWQLGALAGTTTDRTLERGLQQIKTQVDEVLEDLREFAEGMHPRVLEDLGLAAALADLGRRVQATTAARIVVDVDRSLSDALESAVASTFYRVAQEAVSNALRHADPATVQISLFASGSAIVLEIHDDGVGFDVASTERAHAGHGIFAMRERTALVNARLSVESHPNRGTIVSAYIEPGSVTSEKTT
jgi:signal transduction histidine kinase